jgi:hypothetical protein
MWHESKRKSTVSTTKDSYKMFIELIKLKIELSNPIRKVTSILDDILDAYE